MVKTACEDKTGAQIWSLVKQISPKTNKRRKKCETFTNEAKEERENIASKFEEIYSAPDLELSEIEKLEHELLLAELRKNDWKHQQHILPLENWKEQLKKPTANLLEE
uniref:Uncharacterized protein n=1 Tax=Spongospora subterranea TaxID=70186 RepID=A0A0H5R3F0_9EUKA|eukprot:CRZ08661.1 hypothetical protein [Spongospora subterranea]